MRWPRPLTGTVLLLCGVSAALAAGQDPQPDLPAPGKVKRQPGKVGPPAAPGAALSDEDALRKAGLDPADGPKLLEYVRQRTVTDPEQERITEIIRRFAADDFDDRDRASTEIEGYGQSALALLKKAERDPDAEVAYRARLALRRMEKVPHAVATGAAVRAVARLKPDGAAAVLLGYLPLADTEAVADTIREALAALAVAGGKAEPALLAALSDPSPVRRAAAYVALTEGGDARERVRVKDAYPKVRQAVLAEADPEARFAGLWALTLTTREKEYVPELVRLLPKLGRGRLWQVEDLLLQLTKSPPKDGRFGRAPDAVGRAADAWVGWWKEKADGVDLAGLKFAPRVRGFTDVIEQDLTRGTGVGRVISLGPDLKEKWRLSNLNFPTDVRVAANGNVWVAEMNTNRVSELTTTGTVVNTRVGLNQPMNLDLLPDGGLQVVTRNQVVRWDKNGAKGWTFNRPNYDIMAGRRLPSGETVFVTNLYQNPRQRLQNLFRVDDKGAAVKPDDPQKPAGVWTVQMNQAMDVVGEDRVLVCELDNSNPNRPVERVAEYEWKTGKETWKYECPPGSGPSSAQRLPNGNTLICLMNQNRLIEVDTSASPAGEVVWEYQAKDGLRVTRGYRR